MEWVQQHFPDAEVVMNVDDVSTMALAVSHGMGLARLPSCIGDTDPSLRRTARVRVAREFLIKSIEGQREVVLGEKSRYFEVA